MDDEKRIITTHFDLKTAENEETFYFFLEHLLKARIDLHIETGQNAYDEEVNMYVANLLNSLLTCQYNFGLKPYLSPFDLDVRNYIREHPGLRNEFVVYKENADFGLLNDAVFLGFHHEGSYHDRVMPEEETIPRVSQYYALAASALAHLRGLHETLVQVLYTLGDHVREIAVIIRKVAADYFDFIERISAGSLYHLQNGIQKAVDMNIYRQKIDQFLRMFQEYKKEAGGEIRDSILAIVKEIQSMNPQFRFDEALL